MDASRSLYVLFYLNIMITVSLNQHCTWSARTVEIVGSCPKTIDETIKSAKTKKCHALANVQKCTEPTKFKYHCLPDHEQSKLVEVCAPEKNISGTCVVYNTKMGELQNNHNTTCSNNTKACPSTYLSTSSHLYVSCHQGITVASTFSRIFVITTPLPNDSENEILIILSTLLVLLTISIVVIVIAVIFWRRKKHSNFIQSNKEEKNTFISEDVNLKIQEMETRVEEEQPLIPRTEEVLAMVEMKRTTTMEKEEVLNLKTDIIRLAEIRRNIKENQDPFYSKESIMQLAEIRTEKGFITKQYSKVDEEYIAASIDIGTTHTKSGFAYFKRKSNQIYHSNVITNIEESVILFSEDRKFLGFGKKAVELYMKSKEQDTLCFIRNFKVKMNLPTRQDICLWRIANQRGRGYVFLLDVYGETIRCVQSKVEEMANESFPGVTKFRWVLTYPETWEPIAKEFLKQAALRAGIPPNRLYLEKEHISAMKWVQMCKNSEQIEKSKLLFLDLGGGSMKMNAFTEKETFVKTEVDSGGITILKAFENCLAEVFSRQVLESYKLKERKDFLRLFDSLMNKSHDMRLVPPSSLHFDVSKIWNVYKVIKNGDFPLIVDKPGIYLKARTLEISQEKFKTFFEECVVQIKFCIRATLNNFPKIRSDAEVHLFGWLLTSDIIFQCVKEEFQRNSIFNIHKIQDPGFCIAKGAVLHGGHI